MLNNMFSSDSRTEIEKQKRLLTRERSELRQISDIIIQKLEKKIQVLATMESTIDRKMASLEQLLQRAETIKVPAIDTSRPNEIISLRERGMSPEEIAQVLEMPMGEVSLILDLNG